MTDKYEENQWYINTTQHLQRLHEQLFCIGRDHMSMYDDVTLKLSLTGAKCNRDYNEVIVKSSIIFPKGKMNPVFDRADAMLANGLLNMINRSLSQLGFEATDPAIQVIGGFTIKFIAENSTRYCVEVFTCHRNLMFHFNKEEVDRLVIENSILKGPKNDMKKSFEYKPSNEPIEFKLVDIENGPSAASLIFATQSNNSVKEEPLLGVTLKKNTPDKVDQWIETYNAGILAKLCLVILSDTWAPKTVGAFAKCFPVLYNDILTNELHVLDLLEDILPIMQPQYHEQTITFFNALQEKING